MWFLEKLNEKKISDWNNIVLKQKQGSAILNLRL